MLFDPNWEAGSKAITQPDPISLEGLIAWLEKQPAWEVYCYGDGGKCLLAQFFWEKTGHRVIVGSASWNERIEDRWSEDRRLPQGFNDLAMSGPRTFGAALKRARALAARS